jgi:hypothetical protein
MTTLSELVRHEFDTAGPDVSFDEVTKKVVAQIINSDDLEKMLTVLVRQYVQGRATYWRYRTYKQQDDDQEDTTPKACRSVGVSKREQFVHPWKAMLETLVVVDSDSGRAKRLGLCTLADMTALTSAMAAKAANLTRRAQAYKFLADNLTSTKAATVSELPIPVLEAFFKATKS